MSIGEHLAFYLKTELQADKEMMSINAGLHLKLY